jgi:RNA polymerase sigma factor (sigma-70 family)
VRVLGVRWGGSPRGDGFERFYRAHYAPVVRLAYALAGSRPVAEELAQEAFVTAHARWSDVGDFDRPDLWVRRVVINRSISYRRREATERRVLEQLHDRHDDGVCVDGDRGDDELWAAMRELSPRQAEALALFYVEDQPISEVARILGLGEETVKTHLKRGRTALAAKLTSRAER